MRMRPLLLALLAASPAAAEPLRQAVVPPDAAIAVPPRGAPAPPAPAPLAAPGGRYTQAETVLLGGGSTMGLGAVGTALLPLLGAAALGAGLAGGGGGGAPASTR